MVKLGLHIWPEFGFLRHIRFSQALSDAHTSSHDKFAQNELLEGDLAQSHKELLDVIQSECTSKWKFDRSFSVDVNNTERLDCSALQKEFVEISDEVARQATLLDKQVTTCETAITAVEWISQWVRSLERRAAEEGPNAAEGYRPISLRKGQLRPYLDELESLRKLGSEQRAVTHFWQVTSSSFFSGMQQRLSI